MQAILKWAREYIVGIVVVLLLAPATYSMIAIHQKVIDKPWSQELSFGRPRLIEAPDWYVIYTDIQPITKTFDEPKKREEPVRIYSNRRIRYAHARR